MHLQKHLHLLPQPARISHCFRHPHPRSGSVWSLLPGSQVYQDRSFTFITKTPPAPVLIKKACGLDKASGVPNKTKVAELKKADLKDIAEKKMQDLNAASVEAAMSMIAGTARSMGITVEE